MILGVPKENFNCMCFTFSRILEMKGSLEMGLKLDSTPWSGPDFFSRVCTTECLKCGVGCGVRSENPSAHVNEKRFSLDDKLIHSLICKCRPAHPSDVRDVERCHCCSYWLSWANLVHGVPDGSAITHQFCIWAKASPRAKMWHPREGRPFMDIFHTGFCSDAVEPFKYTKWNRFSLLLFQRFFNWNMADCVSERWRPRHCSKKRSRKM